MTSRLTCLPRRTLAGALVVWIALFATGCVFGTPETCTDAEELLTDAAAAAERTDDGAATTLASIPLEDAVMSDMSQFPGLTMTSDDRLTIQEAADTRYDPETLDQLERLGYTDGLVRVWKSESVTINESVFEFADAAGAVAYQGYVTRYACGFADDVFAAPDGGIGLQLRYSSDPQVRDQISWVVGNRRFALWVGVAEGTTTHGGSLEVYDYALAQSRGE